MKTYIREIMENHLGILLYATLFTVEAVTMFNYTAVNAVDQTRLSEHVYVVILAGGTGERLWPYSRVACPKQLLTIGSDKTLLEQAIDRVQGLAGRDRIWVVTTSEHEAKIRDCVGLQVSRVLVEPSPRNTGPAIAYCCVQIMEKDPDAVLFFVPADAFIPEQDETLFIDSAKEAIACAQAQDSICLLGITPTYAATGYGYIECDSELKVGNSFKVNSFREKPCKVEAQRYLSNSNMLWNTCTFAGRVSRFIKEFEIHAPALLYGVQNFCNGTATYHEVESLSIDYAVIEKTNRIWVTPCLFSWCDVGNVAVFLGLKQQYEKKENVVLVDSNNNLVDVPGKLVALIDVDNLCVIQTDDVLLITKKESTEKVRNLVSSIKQKQLNDYL